jgi:hypothetical protein
MRKLRVPAAVAGAAAAILFAAAPAQAAPTPTLYEHSTTEGVVDEGGATSAVQQIGLHLTTPSGAKTNFSHSFLSDTAKAALLGGDPPYDEDLVPLWFVQEMSYQTKKLDSSGSVALPALKLEMACDEDHPYTTLVFEPYKQPGQDAAAIATYGNWKTWIIDDDSLFWSTFDIGGFGNDGQTTKPLGDIKELCPDGILISLQVGLGSSSTPAEGLTDQLYFYGKRVHFPAQVIPAGLARGMAANALPEGSMWEHPMFEATEFAIKHIWKKPLAGTGADLTIYIASGIALVLLGSAVVFLTAMRRRRRVA